MKRERCRQTVDTSKSSGAGIDFFLEAIGYPERVPDGSGSFTLRVDDGEVRAEAYNGRIVLSRVLTEDASMLPQLASYAVGRILKESAVLSCDEKAKAFLWQDASLDSGERGMLRLFETFMNSCDWWRERIDAMGGNGSGAGEEEETMKIRP